MNSPNLHKCLNCEAPIDANYCSNCGQSTSVHRITFRETFNDFFSSSFALEGPLMSTIRLLTLNPGRLFREFLSGKRKSYYKPVAFFVLLTAIYIIVRSGIGYDPFQNQSQMNGEGVHEKAKPFIEAGKFMVANINNIMFFLVFSIGFSHKLFFRKKYLLAEYVTIGFFIAGIYLIFGLLLMIYSVTISFVTPQYATIFLFIYLFYSAISFHQRLSFGSFIKYLLLSVLSIFLYILLGFGFSLFVVVFS